MPGGDDLSSRVLNGTFYRSRWQKLHQLIECHMLHVGACVHARARMSVRWNEGKQNELKVKYTHRCGSFSLFFCGFTTFNFFFFEINHRCTRLTLRCTKFSCLCLISQFLLWKNIVR